MDNAVHTVAARANWRDYLELTKPEQGRLALNSSRLRRSA